MKRIKLSLKKRLEQINVWKAECQLLLMILGCISAVAVFCRNLFMGKITPPGLSELIDLPESLKGLGTGGGGLGTSPLFLPNLVQPVPITHASPNSFMYVNIAVIIILAGLIVYFGIKVLNKRRLPKS